MFNNFDFSVILPSLPYIWEGLMFSFRLTVTAMLGGIIIGTLLALARLSGGKTLGFAAKTYVDLMRSVPLLMMILWFFLLAPFFIKITPETSALITFTLFQAAFYSEIMRAGIQSIPRGQINASFAIGMTYWQTMGYVILPQAFRNMIPVLLTQTFILFQDTSLVYAIGATDLLKAADNTGKLYGRTVEMLIFVSLIYFVICFSLSMFVKYMNKRIAIIR
ncbi:ABC transporter permease subunit [Uliginosibacterium sp. 31-16]|uniref:amino acid ABC transporter permease n=1 Tax=Uliginosibacterium sp. 31-16 TaxID=3068315 RepID=UPI00273F01CA|nr:ABC transporter permease subunit [Uliginosibacterium sp. 31-16]MDP5239403.1 ABC transporter permease subunit [Uliginosibacterium sp. 31-16]